MKIEKYFNDKSGIFTALAIFSAFAIISEEKSLFLSFSGFFISFILLSYLLEEFSKIEKVNTWGWLLYMGYNILFLAMLIYGIDKFNSLNNKVSMTIMVIIVISFYVYTTIKALIKQIKKEFNKEDKDHFGSLKGIGNFTRKDRMKDSRDN